MKILPYLLCAILVNLAQEAVANTHCSNAEKVVFSCSTGKKIVSLCASNNLSASNGYMQYRFGAKDNVELTYPQTQIHPRGKFEVKRQTPILDNGNRAKLTEVSFKQGDIKYIIDSMDTGNSDKTTLNVERNGKQLASFVCNNASIVNKDFSYFDILDNFVEANNAVPVKQTVPQALPSKQPAPQQITTAFKEGFCMGAMGQALLMGEKFDSFSPIGRQESRKVFNKYQKFETDWQSIAKSCMVSGVPKSQVINCIENKTTDPILSDYYKGKYTGIEAVIDKSQVVAGSNANSVCVSLATD